MLAEKNPIAIVHLFEMQFTMRRQFVVRRQGNIERIVRNGHEMELRCVGNACYHGKVLVVAFA